MSDVDPTVQRYPDSEALAAGIAERLTERITSVQAEGRTARIVLTGGTIAIDAYRKVSDAGVDWSRVELWFGDERFVPEGHEDRNDRQARDAFLDRVGVPAAHVHAMPSHGCGSSLAEAADSYAAGLPQEPFDVVLLGMGPDAHVASLFPGFEQLHEQERDVVEVFSSPKPPAERISLTFPALNRTRATWFLVSGSGKAEAVRLALDPQGDVEKTPARGARGLLETTWLIDEDAASDLPRT